jgi:pyruvate formate lyase activating enzyme
VNTNKEHTSDSSLYRKSIYSLTPFTLIDYPEKTSCVLWFAGCNMRCSYCYNPEIVLGKGKLSFCDIREFLYSRRDLLDGVVLSGGECLLHDSVKDIITAIKEMKFLIKIDTNGSRPHVLKHLIESFLIDYVSLDFKAPPVKFSKITTSEFYYEFIQSLNILISSKVTFEVRTTIHSSLFTISDIQSMVDILWSSNYEGKYFLQHFRPGLATLGNLEESNFAPSLKDIAGHNIDIIFR